MKDELIQIGGKSYKKCDVVMLPTEKASPILLTQGKLYYTPDNQEPPKNSAKNQHLYILSDENIKENEKFFRLGYGIINKLIVPQTSKDKKIIVTTNESLRIHKEDIPCDKGYYTSLPRPSDDFLKAFVEAQGKITKVLVEYEYIENESWSEIGGAYDTSFYQLKVAKDNTITIKPVQDNSESIGKNAIEYCKQYAGTDKHNVALLAIEFGYQLAQKELETESIQEEKTSWSREEVEIVLFNMAEHLGTLSSKQDIKTFNSWIKENL